MEARATINKNPNNNINSNKAQDTTAVQKGQRMEATKVLNARCNRCCRHCAFDRSSFWTQ